MSKSPALSKREPAQKPHDSHPSNLPIQSHDEAQVEELEVLQSIYGDDYRDVETKKAWNRAIERSFKLTLRSNIDGDVSVVIFVTLTSTYPKSCPQIRVEEVRGVRQNALTRIKDIIVAKPKELLPSGEVMIFEIASAVQEVLDDEVSARARDDQLPSLEEERAKKEAAGLEAQRLEEEARHQLEEEARLMETLDAQRRLEQEVKKREEAEEAKMKRKSMNKPVDTDPSMISYEQVHFDQAITFKDELRNQHQFTSVYLFRTLAQTASGTIYTATPPTPQPQSMCFVIKRSRRIKLCSKEVVLRFEKLMEGLLKLNHHANIVNVLAFKLTPEDDLWQCDILTDFATRGSLAEMLDMVGEIPAQKARTYIKELLQALEYYHKHRIVHGRIHAGNILFTSLQSGIVGVKIADAGFAAFLQNECSQAKVNDRRTTSAWLAPESQISYKTDIWDLGVVLVQILLGLEIKKTYSSPARLMDDAGLSSPLVDLLAKVFHADHRKRPSPFELITFEFLRTDCSVLSSVTTEPRRRPISQASANTPRRFLRSESSNVPTAASRYLQEWEQIGRLGKGGYGEVVKARNKLDGQIYAVKKVSNKSPSDLNQVLSEVYLLATLNHPYVVRYFVGWAEADEDEAVDDSSYADSSTGDGIVFGNSSDDSDDSEIDLMTQSTGGLDFMSASYPNIEFAEDDVEDQVDEDEESESAIYSSGDSESDSGPTTTGRMNEPAASFRSKGKRAKSFSKVAVRSTLYIQMEYCERLTLRDMIRKGFSDRVDDMWRLFRQVLEGLVHIHAHGIIHRDLKPENVFIDAANNPRIGDFGLATSGHKAIDTQQEGSGAQDDDLTRDVGTAMYVAPELRSKGGVSYTDKIDMYSLGIMLFEMCYPLTTGMERMQVITRIREKDHKLPEAFDAPDKALQAEIIKSLITHRPSERPSSTQLVQSDKIPMQVEDETIRLALKGLADESSPYHQRIISALFSEGKNSDVKAQLYDKATSGLATSYLLLQGLVKEKLTACFRRHGAVELPRHGLLPRSDHYSAAKVVRLLDVSGTMVQLPVDLTLPLARLVANQDYIVEKSFVLGTAYRSSQRGIAPRSVREADFDIISTRRTDLTLHEAEAIKVLDEVTEIFPSLRRAPMCFHISHGTLLDLILDFCRIRETVQRSAVKEVLGRLNIGASTWPTIRHELRSATIGVSSTSLDELARFDFRDTPEKCLTKVQAIFRDTAPTTTRVDDVFTKMIGLVEYCRRLGVKRKIFFSPLSNYNEHFYQNGIMFQLLFDNKKREVVGAGGRYDSLVAEFRPRMLGVEGPSTTTAHAVGFNLAWDSIINSMLRYVKNTGGGTAFLKKDEEQDTKFGWTPRRCDVLIGSIEPSILRSTGLDIVSKLWASDISAELAADVQTQEELITRYREEKHSWIVTVKHEDISSNKPDLKVKSVETNTDHDVRSPDLVNFLRAEIRERGQREGTDKVKILNRQSSHPAPADHFGSSSSSSRDVQVLLANHKSKKGNKWRIVEQAQQKVPELLRSYADGPIACVETRDEIVEMIRETKLSDPESWRRVAQEVNLNERAYVQEIWEMLKGYKAQYGDGQRNAFVYNFRSGLIILYDLCL